MQRVVQPELLDSLPAEDPRAVHSRRDLRILNGWMGSASILVRAIADISKPAKVMDLGAGDGAISLAIAKKSGWTDTEFVLVDRHPTATHATLAAFNAIGCDVTFRERDVLTGLGGETADLIIANLFLHHFSDKELSQLLAEVAACCTVFAACEPRRTPLSRLASYCVGTLGCNAVTRHDAVVSVRAGFRDSDLSARWPNADEWALRERRSGLFSHLFVARKR